VRRASIGKVLGLLPVQIVEIRVCVVPAMLYVTRVVVSNKGVAVVCVVHHRCRDAPTEPQGVKALAEILVYVLSVRQDALVCSLGIVTAQRVCPEPTIAMPNVALDACQSCVRLAHLVSHRSPAEATRVEEHPVERIGYSVSDEVVGHGAREDTAVVVACVAQSVRCSRHSAPMINGVIESKWTRYDVVLYVVVHLVSILDVDASSADVP